MEIIVFFHLISIAFYHGDFMAFDLKKLAETAKPRPERNRAEAEYRMQNKEWMRMSQDIALSIHRHLRITGMTQKEFAEKMGVSPAYVGKLLKGQENLTLETIWKIQQMLGITFFVSPFNYSAPDEYMSVVAESLPKYGKKKNDE